LRTRVPLFLVALGFLAAPALAEEAPPQPQKPRIVKREEVTAAESLIGLRFDDAKRDQMLSGLDEQLGHYQKLRKVPLPNNVAPALYFNPLPTGFKPPAGKSAVKLSPPARVEVPPELEKLAFLPLRDLAELLRTRKVSSEALTRMYLDRLERFDPQLHAVITLTRERALEQAKRADAEIAAGRYRGPLHGIPYGAKDLLATRGIRTTWGAAPYKDQVIDEDATVVERLEKAGAVLVAKLTLGELAWGDIWYGEKTRNPWNLERGSSGSSAGPGSAVAAGLVPFAIGSETLGSIVSPSSECGVTGLRPTFGRVSRAGAMALSWSMDKLGPMCRTVEDCAIVFDAIRGPDGKDPTVLDAPFRYAPTPRLDGLRLGYVKADFEKPSPAKANHDAVLGVLKGLGAELVPFELPPYPTDDMIIVLSAEAGAAFDELTRSGRDELMVRQIPDAWPNAFRLSRFIPAVEYIQANRVRTLTIEDMARRMRAVHAYVTPSFGDSLTLTNLTGHPAVVVPDGFTEKGLPTSITFIGQLYAEGELLRVARAYQEKTGFHLKRPPLADPAAPRPQP